jgi:hypothetical protein
VDRLVKTRRESIPLNTSIGQRLSDAAAGLLISTVETALGGCAGMPSLQTGSSVLKNR